jgi:hypothetical protein
MKMPFPISSAIVGFIIFFAFGAAAYFIYKQNATFARWPTAIGVVTVSDKKLTQWDSGGTDHRRVTGGMAVIEYTYKVGGIVYIGNSNMGSIGGMSHRETINANLIGPTDYASTPPSAKFQAFLSKYAVGTSVTMHYNPLNPKESVLEVNDTSGINISGGIAFAGLLIMVVFLAYYFIKKS